jgi:hypothetical protein
MTPDFTLNYPEVKMRTAFGAVSGFDCVTDFIPVNIAHR